LHHAPVIKHIAELAGFQDAVSFAFKRSVQDIAVTL
jgi:hypothetical protein